MSKDCRANAIKTYKSQLSQWLEGTKTAADTIQIAISMFSPDNVPRKYESRALSGYVGHGPGSIILIRKGVPFRDTHHISGHVVALAKREGKPMDQLSKKQVQSMDERFGDDMMSCPDYERNAETTTVNLGGTSWKKVEEQIELIVKMLELKTQKSVFDGTCQGHQSVVKQKRLMVQRV